MWTNYFKLAVRRMKREKLFSVLNISGLTIGVTAFILISLYVRYELSFDKFHSKGKQIYALTQHVQSLNGEAFWERFSVKGASVMRSKIPELKMMTQIRIDDNNDLVTIGQEKFYESKVLQTDKNFLEVFDFQLLEGSNQLDEPYKSIITESTVTKYFGAADPLGQLLKIEDEGEFEIVGIIKNPPANSHISFSIIISNHHFVNARINDAASRDQWGPVASNFVLLPEGVDIGSVEGKMAEVQLSDFPESMATKAVNGEVETQIELFPFLDIHLNSGFSWSMSPVNDISYIYLFSFIGILILAIACFNYINLVTARSIKRAKEIGLRKVIGAQRKQIILQQMTEAFAFTFLSVFLAFAIAERLLPYYSNLVEQDLALTYGSAEFFVFIFGLSLVVALLAGYYPAFRLSKLSPTNAIKGASSGKGKSTMRRGLVLFQFLIAQALIITTFVIQYQLHYLQTKSLGYDREHVLYIDAKEELQGKRKVFHSNLSAIPGVKSISFSNNILSSTGLAFFKLNEIEGFEDAPASEMVIADLWHIDSAYTSTMGMKMLVYGTSNAALGEVENQMIITESTTRKMGWENDAIGKQLELWGKLRTVVGVVEDFHNGSLKNEMRPAFMLLDSRTWMYVSIKVDAADVMQTMDAIEQEWAGLVDGIPLEFQFYDDYYNAQYDKEIRLGSIFNVFATIAIGISILGLIGLTTYSAEQRLKEFGIRKVLGARLSQLVFLLSKEFLALILLSFLVACPITYFVMSDWLTAFAYRIDIGAFIYILALASAAIIALLAVGLQSARVGSLNPSEILRNE